MKMRITVLPLALIAAKDLAASAFAPLRLSSSLDRNSRIAGPALLRMGYLDDLSRELYKEVDEPDLEKTYEATKAKAEETDRYGVGDWKEFVDFEEFDGGDGQMGVAGDGKKGLEKVRRPVVEWERDALLLTRENVRLSLSLVLFFFLRNGRSGRVPRSWPNPRR
jgi:hypothetical protein